MSGRLLEKARGVGTVEGFQVGRVGVEVFTFALCRWHHWPSERRVDRKFNNLS